MTGESRALEKRGLERDLVPVVVVVGEAVEDAEEEEDEVEVVEEGVVEEIEVGVVVVEVGAREGGKEARAGPDPPHPGGTTAWLGRGFPRESTG